MSYINKFLLGVTEGGYRFLSPPDRGAFYSDAEMVELAALIVAMKPQLRTRFDERLREVESGS